MAIILYFLEQVSFSHKYSIWTRGWCYQKPKGANELKNIRSIHRMANFMFKYTNIYFKK